MGTSKHKLWRYDMRAGKKPQSEVQWSEGRLTTFAAQPDGGCARRVRACACSRRALALEACTRMHARTRFHTHTTCSVSTAALFRPIPSPFPHACTPYLLLPTRYPWLPPPPPHTLALAGPPGPPSTPGLRCWVGNGLGQIEALDLRQFKVGHALKGTAGSVSQAFGVCCAAAIAVLSVGKRLG